jgi:site-specific DNA-methyltransferase (adenine-specific)
MTVRNLGWLNSVWRITTVNPFLTDIKERHAAPFPEEIPNRLINLFSKKGDYVLDPFCGSGTTNFMAIRLGRKTIGYDIEQKYIDMAKKRCDNGGLFFCKSSEKMDEVFDNAIKLCITSPPYLYLRKYSDDPKNIGNVENPYPLLKKVFEEVYRVLKFGGHFCLNVSDVPEETKPRYLTNFPYDLLNMCKQLGFQLKNTIIWDKDVTLKEWNIKFNKIMENHEYIWILVKPYK